MHFYEATQCSPSVQNRVFSRCAKNGSAHVSGAMLEPVERGLRHEAEVSTSGGGGG